MPVSCRTGWKRETTTSPGWPVCWEAAVPPAAGIHSLFCHEAALVRQAAEGLAQLPRVQVYSAGEKGCQSGVLSFRVAGRDPGWVAEELGQRGIAVRAGLHCAPLAHATGGTEATGTVRVSFSAFNTGQEVERFLKTMRRLG
ncbi:MAG: aminotransferase class V-fold PLP-dependent enzyme [Evtepia gabavorous]